MWLETITCLTRCMTRCTSICHLGIVGIAQKRRDTRVNYRSTSVRRRGYVEMHLRWLTRLVKHGEWPDCFCPKPCAVRAGLLVKTALSHPLDRSRRVCVLCKLRVFVCHWLSKSVNFDTRWVRMDHSQKTEMVVTYARVSCCILVVAGSVFSVLWLFCAVHLCEWYA